MLSDLNTAPVAESEDHKANITKVFSADIVEGMLAEGLGEIKRSLDVLYHNPGNMEQHVNAAACRSIAPAGVDGKPFAGFDLPQFGNDIVQFLTAFHRVLSVETSTTDRNAELRRFCRGIKK